MQKCLKSEKGTHTIPNKFSAKSIPYNTRYSKALKLYSYSKRTNFSKKFQIKLPFLKSIEIFTPKGIQNSHHFLKCTKYVKRISNSFSPVNIPVSIRVKSYYVLRKLARASKYQIFLDMNVHNNGEQIILYNSSMDLLRAIRANFEKIQIKTNSVRRNKVFSRISKSDMKQEYLGHQSFVGLLIKKMSHSSKLRYFSICHSNFPKNIPSLQAPVFREKDEQIIALYKQKLCRMNKIKKISLLYTDLLSSSGISFFQALTHIPLLEKIKIFLPISPLTSRIINILARIKCLKSVEIQGYIGLSGLIPLLTSQKSLRNLAITRFKTDELNLEEAYKFHTIQNIKYISSLTLDSCINIRSPEGKRLFFIIPERF